MTSFVAARSFPAVEPGVARRRFADQAVESPDGLARRKSCDRPGEWSFPKALPGRSRPHPELPSWSTFQTKKSPSWRLCLGAAS